MKRIVLVLVAVAAAVSLADYLACRAAQQQLLAEASRTGLLAATPGLEIQLRRETEPARAESLAAWLALDREVDRRWLDELPGSQQRAQAALAGERLRLARELAERTLLRRPASWQAATTLGMTRYLEAERGGRRSQPPAAWSAPLRAAMELAPGQPEPALFLASALLSRWSSLDAAHRNAALPVLSRALETPRGLDILLPLWVRLAPSLDRLLEVIPERPHAWQKLGQTFRDTGDLERFATAHRRWLASLPGHQEAQITQARARLRAGDTRRGLDHTHQAMKMPADPAFAPGFEEALALLPDALDERRFDHDLRRWLDWSLDLCVLTECPLAAPSLSRLAARVGGLHPADAALTELVAGVRTAPEAATGPGADARWRRTWIHAAARLAATDPAAAQRALDRASPLDGPDPLYWLAAESVAETRGDEAGLARARRELQSLAEHRWSTADWRSLGRTSRLLLLTARGCRGLRLAIDGVPPEGAVIELRWNGRIMGVAALAAGEDLVWQLEAQPGAHRIELTSLTQQPLRPGDLALRLAPPPG